MYQEFFEKNVPGNKSKLKKNVRFEINDDDDIQNNSDENTNDSIEKDNDEHLSTLEKRSARLSKHISKLEEQAVSENKPWPLKGEVAAKDRPQNSLLEEAVEFDVCTRPG